MLDAQDQNEAHFIKQLIKMMNLHISNQSNSIYMGGKVKLIDALNESNVSSIQPILQYIESNRIVEIYHLIALQFDLIQYIVGLVELKIH
jgi:heat-inducible transcriptional repressor